MKVKIISNQLGKCPYCNSEKIHHSFVQFEFDQMYFKCRCDECNKYFEEWNSLTFTGYNVGRRGEYEASEYLNKVIEYMED